MSKSIVNLIKLIPLVFVVLIVGLILLFSTWYTVDESEQAVVETFGNPGETITDSGLHFKMPWPIQKVEILEKKTFSLKFGYTTNEKGEEQSVTSEAKMITGDENIVLTDLIVQWKISDPIKYLYGSDNPLKILYNATSSSIRSIIGSSTIDAALTDGKADIEVKTTELLKELINSYDIGVTVLNVKLQDVELPNEEVRAAFTAVTDARETKNTKTNEADKYKNQKLSEAEGEKDAIISDAESKKTKRINEAKGDVAVFNEVYKEYATNKNITETRLSIEMLEDVLPDLKIYITDDSSGTVKYLPIESLSKTNKSESKE